MGAMTATPGITVTLTRRDLMAYTATNGRGASIEVGGQGNFSPVELLLAAIGGCTAVDVDVMTSRRAEPTPSRSR